MIPLSYAQRGLWFLHKFSGDDGAYHVPFVLHFGGPVDRTALGAALRDVVIRHESLRTLFIEVNGEVRQHVVRAPRVGPVMTTSEVVSDDVEAAVAAVVARPFDLRLDLPMRAELLARGAPGDVLVVVTHHIANDGWSEDVFRRDLEVAYEARRAGSEPEWPELPIQYADYTLWQHELLGEPSDPESLISKQLAHWVSTLADLPADPALPVLSPAAATEPTSGFVTFELDAGVHGRLAEIARQAGVTMFMLVHASLAALIARLGGVEDLPLGTVVSGRSDQALDELIGYFTNTLVLRTDTSGNPTFLELLHRVRDVDLAAFANQDAPFEKVVEAVNPVRTRAGSPLFQIVFSLGDRVSATFKLDGTEVRIVPFRTGVAKFDLDVGMEEVRTSEGVCGGIAGRLEFRLDQLDLETAAAMAGALCRLMTSVAEQPAARIAELNVLDATEREPQLTGRNLTRTRHLAEDATLQRHFAEQVARTPEAVAVRSAGISLTYQDLDVRSNRLARRLLALGLRPEEPVAVLMARSADLIVTLLAIIKAGGCYLPLNSADPFARQQYAIDTAGAATVLTDAVTNTGKLPVCARVVTVDDAALGEGIADDPTTGGHPDRLAYVMFTSGSTGHPKGVCVTHRGVLNLAGDRCWDETGHERVLMAASYAFDVSTYEIWVPLLRGGCVVVAPTPNLEIETLERLLVEEEVTAVSLSAGLFQVVAEESPQSLAVLREVMTGGDVVTPHAVNQVLATNPDITVRYAYGPTEATVQVTQTVLAAPLEGARVSIGRPMDNCGIFVLDRRLNPLPAGMVGELYLAGPGLARGYAGSTASTAERFVANPFGTPSERMYRTGDLARRRPATGELEFMGRTDGQLKVRGFRIEPGEVEHVLCRHPGVLRAAVLLIEGDATGNRLVAYVLADADKAPTTEELRAFVGAAVPRYMVPAEFVVLDRFPLTSNGKLDRNALPRPSAAEGIRRVPDTPREKILCDLFAELLGTDVVGVDDDFFALGGHSLLATRLVSRIRSVLDVEISIQSLFETPTVAGLAARLPEVAASGVGRPPLTRLNDCSRRLPLSFGQQRQWFGRELFGSNAIFNIPMELRISGDLDRQALRAALADVVQRHEPLRTRFPAENGVPYQDVMSADEVMTGWTEVGCAPEDVQDEVMRAASYEFDLRVEPPLRFWLFVEAPDEYVLLFLVHHIAADGWSFKVFWKELETAYTARLAGEEPSWVPLPVRYADYALWQHAMVGQRPDGSDGFLARQVDFWRTALHGVPEFLKLPFDWPYPATRDHRGGDVIFTVPADVHRKLSALAQELGATLMMVVQAAWAALLTRMGAGTDIPVAMSASGRTEDELASLIGFFTNTLLVRTDTSGDPGFRELVRRVRQTNLAAYSNQLLPFQRVVELVNPTRSGARYPLFQILLTVRNHDGSGPTLPGLRTAEKDLTNDTAKYDLTVGVAEQVTSMGEPAGLNGDIEFATDVFSRITVERIADRLTGLLRQVADDPDLAVGRLDILLENERKQLVPQAARPERSLADRISRQARLTPHRNAVVTGSSRLSYAELDARSGRLARLLVAAGAGPETAVAVAAAGPVELLVGMVSVVKAGAMYVQADTSVGTGPLQVVAVLGDGTHAGESQGGEVPVISLIASSPIGCAGAEESSLPVVVSSAAAYVGCRGIANGVLVTYEALEGFADGYGARAERGEKDRVLMQSADADRGDLAELLGPLAWGATVEVGPVLRSSPCGDRPSSLVTPAPGRTAYVLDGGLRLVPIGVVGELYVGDVGRGYVGRAGLTAERFVACPFGEVGARMYRTGVLARWAASGSLEFIDEAGTELAAVHDRKGLAPAPGLEKRLRKTFAEILGVERIGSHDVFFDAGGSSLLVCRLLDRVRSEFGIKVPMERFFDAPTVAGLLAVASR
ncbi:non-ribosomal peptide synthetase [Amycolatopsis sp. PS_44_ISF1]|uniref:non-ribosomal peptide synthetase n=1 Tax=Amycolatopsis sp. PS_44_ISF1 TaxID=2974917 RepID=UPI0028DE6A2A|nr:non-ribosomal peptide synthetase [Amycolatopsis sp. PS_44_ISF1]MDT8916007.1 amino acid adenylation domain-containing protein [Amycolatopsis sp. PS_44_ISF1]